MEKCQSKIESLEEEIVAMKEDLLKMKERKETITEESKGILEEKTVIGVSYYLFLWDICFHSIIFFAGERD